MANYVNSYEYQNKIRDLSEAFNQIVQKSPVLSFMVANSGIAYNTKHEWLEDVISQQGTVLTAWYTAADGSLTVDDSSFAQVGDILIAELSTGASTTVQWKVDAVVDANTLTVSVLTGSTDEDVANGAKIKLISRPRQEGSSPVFENGTEPSVEYNYTQIFDRSAKVSKTSNAISMYGIENALDYQVQNQLKYLAMELNNAIIHGIRAERTVSEQGRLWGILYFLQNATGNKVDASWGALSATILNNAFEKGYNNGATNMNTIMCNTTQARKISALNTSGDNPIIQRGDTQAGGYVMSFVSDLPVAGGLVSNIVVDQSFPQDKVALLDMSKIKLATLQWRQMQDFDATNPGVDFVSRRIIGEMTLEMKNAGESHILINDLSL